MDYCFRYKVTLPERDNAAGKYDEVSKSLWAWFKKEDIRFGMGSLGGSLNVYGSVHGDDCKWVRTNSRTPRWLARGAGDKWQSATRACDTGR